MLRRLLKPPVVIVLMALLFRLALILALGSYHRDPAEDHIAFGYETGRVARSIVLGQGIGSPFRGPSGPTGVLMPVYPYLLAGVFKLFGIYTTASALAIMSLNSLFSALTCLPVFYIGEKTFGRTVGNIAAWAWAFHPVAVFISVVRIWETTLTTLLLTLILLAMLYLERTTRLRAWLGFGLLCGLMALSNPGIVAVLPFLGAWLGYRLRQRGARPGGPIVLAALVFLVSISPWFIRNYLAFHHFVPFRTNFGLELQIGNNPLSIGAPVHALHPIRNPEEFEKYRRMGELAYIAEKKREALRYIGGHPGRFLELTLLRMAYSWTYIWQVSSDTLRAKLVAAAGFVGFGLQSFLAFLGLVLAARSGKKEAVPFVAFLIFFPMVYYVTFAQLRFRHPLEPLMIILCVYALRRVFYGERAELPVPALAPSASASASPTTLSGESASFKPGN